MAGLAIIDPQGIDKPIESLRNKFTNDLWTTSNYDSCGRAWVNDNENKEKEPFVYVGTGEYQSVFVSDEYDARSFFKVSDNRDYESNNFTTEVEIIFSVNLKAVKPSLLHRASEEVITDVMNILYKQPYGFNVKSVKTGISQVYRDFNYSNNQADQQPYFLFSVVCDVRFTNYSCV